MSSDVGVLGAGEDALAQPIDRRSSSSPNSPISPNSPHAEFVQALEQESGPLATNQIEVAAPIQDVAAACRTSLDFLASLVLTDLYEYGYCDILKSMWQYICSSALKIGSKDRFALGIPRGFSKTILLKLWVLWLVLFTDRKFILIICATEGHAQNFIADVCDMLDNQNIVAVFGNWRNQLEKDTQGLLKFSFRGRDIIIGGLGAGGSPRGLNIKFVRPDVVLMDDIQKKEEAANTELANGLLVWMLGTLMKACHPRTCTFVFVANMYPYEGSLLRKLKHSNEWLAIITGAITVDGESIWPEHRSIEDLLQELAVDTEMGHPEVFFSEVMNDEEAGTVSGIDVSKLPELPLHLYGLEAQGGYVIIDPSLGKKKSDNVAIGAFLVFDGIPVLWEVVEGKFNPGETIQHATLLAMKYRMQLICVEGVAYQESLCYWFTHVFKQLGIEGIEVATITPAGMAKNTRIRDGLKNWLKGMLLVHRDCRSKVVYQVTQWNPLKIHNVDDLLDLLAYARPILEKYPTFVPLILDEGFIEQLPPGSHAEDLELAF